MRVGALTTALAYAVLVDADRAALSALTERAAAIC